MSLADNLEIATWSINKERNILNLSPVLKHWIGCSDEENHNPSLLYGIVYKEDIQAFDDHMLTLLQGQPSSLEYRILLPIGELKWIQSIGIPIRNNDNNVIRIDGTVLDLTKKRKAQQLLEDKCSLFQGMIQTIDMAIWSYDHASRQVLFISDAIGMITGYPSEKFMDINFWRAIVHKDDVALYDQKAALVSQGASDLNEYRIIHSNGEVRWIQVRIIPCLSPNNGGLVARFDGAVVDITARKDMEEALYRSEQRYKSLFEYNTDILCELDVSGTVLDINPMGRQHVEESSTNSAEDFAIMDAFGAEHRETMQYYFDQALQGYSQPYTITTSPLNGEISHWHLNNIPIYVNNQIVGAFNIAKDVTVRNRVQNELRDLADIENKLLRLDDQVTLIEDRTATKRAELALLESEELKRIRESEERYYRLQMSLDRFSQDLFGVMKISQMEQRLLDEIQDVLKVTKVSVIKVEHNKDSLCRIIETKEGYSLKIGEINGASCLLSIAEKPITLEAASTRMWLETITRYVSVLYDHFLLIEDLTKELRLVSSYQVAPKWLLRFMFKLSENERKHLAQDLHDAALQEQIILYRKLDRLVTNGLFPEGTKEQLAQITQGLLDVIYQIRITCNELRPPMLIKEGLIASLEVLFDFTQLRGNYRIEFNVADFNDSLNDESLLGLYRIVQELLANATKHSSATEVRIHIASQDRRIRMEYVDNGIGMDLTAIEDSYKSMGLYGIKERVRSMDGTVEFNSRRNNGLAVSVSIPAYE